MFDKFLQKISKYDVEIKIFLLCFIAFSYFITGFHSANEGSAFALIKSMVEEGKLSINTFKDYASVDISKYNGNYYSDKPPGRSFMGIPVYILDKLFGFTSDFQVYMSLELLTSLFSALGVVVFYKFTIFLNIDKKHALILSFVYGFATILFTFSKTFFAHPYSAFFNLLALYTLLLALESNQRKYLIYSGVAMGISFLMEYTNILVIAVFGIYYLYRNRLKNIPNIFMLGISFLAIASILLVYDYLIFGNPFTTTESYQLSYGNILQTQLFKTAELKNGLYGLLFSETSGLFYFSPVLLLSIPGLLYWIRNDFYNTKTKNRFLGLVLFLSFAAILIFYAAKEGWRGGNSYGPRYLLVVIPFLVIPIAEFFRRYGKYNLFWLVFAALLIYSIFVSALGALVDPTPAELFTAPVYQHNLSILLSNNFDHFDSYLNSQGSVTLLFMIFVWIIIFLSLLKNFIHSFDSKFFLIIYFIFFFSLSIIFVRYREAWPLNWIEPDLNIFQNLSKMINQGKLPIANFSIDVYPVAFALILAILSPISQNLSLFIYAFSLIMAVFVVATAFLLLKILELLRLEKKRIIFFLLSPTLLIFNWVRFDIIPVFFLVLALYELLKNKNKFAGFFAGIGILFKMFPAFLVAADFLRERKFFLIALLIFTLINVPFLLLNFQNTIYPYTSFISRTANPDSFYGMLEGKFNMSQNFVTLLSISIAILYLLFVRFKGGVLETTIILTILFFVASKNFSPQWIIWLVPLLVLTKIDLRYILLLDVTNVLVFPFFYPFYPQFGLVIILRLVLMFIILYKLKLVNSNIKENLITLKNSIFHTKGLRL